MRVLSDDKSGFKSIPYYECRVTRWGHHPFSKGRISAIWPNPDGRDDHRQALRAAIGLESLSPVALLIRAAGLHPGSCTRDANWIGWDRRADQQPPAIGLPSSFRSIMCPERPQHARRAGASLPRPFRQPSMIPGLRRLAEPDRHPRRRCRRGAWIWGWTSPSQRGAAGCGCSCRRGRYPRP